MPRLVRPFIDKHGQEYVSLNCAATRIGTDRNLLDDAKKAGFVSTYTIQGAPAVKWPQVRDQWRKYKARKTVPVVSKDRPTDDDSGIIQDDEENETRRGPGRPKDLQAASATATKMTYSAELLRLEYETKLGKLVPVDIIQVAWMNIADSVKKAMLSIPDRVAAIIAGDVTQERYHEVHRTLTVEITNALQNLEVVDVAITAAEKKGISGKS